MNPNEPSHPDTGRASHEPEGLLRAAFEGTPAGIALLDLSGRFLRVNPALCSILGREEHELLSLGWRDVTHPLDHAVQERYEREALAGGPSTFEWEKRYVRPDGSQVWTHISRTLTRDQAGRPEYFISQVLDISERIESQAQLDRQREELAALHETTVDLIRRLEPTSLLGAILSRAAGLIGAEHGYLYVVDERAGDMVVRAGIGLFADHLGYRLGPGKGVAGRVWETGEPLAIADYHDWGGRVEGFDMLRALVALPLRAANEIVGVMGLAHVEPEKRFTPEEVDLLSRYARLASVALDNARLYSAAQDELRERRRAEKELERAADDLKRANEELRTADELKDHFVAVTSHELRTPLTSVLGFSKTLLNHWERISDDQKREQIGLIRDQSDRLMRLVDALLTVSKIEAGALEVDPQPIRLSDSIHAVVSSFGEALAGIEIDVRADQRVLADPDHLHQILTNYLANALTYGRPPITITAREADGHVEVRISDSGDGVPPAFVPRLFERFAQAGSAPGGTGLGLSIVRGLARAQGGDIWYEPGEPRGSTFGVRLPAP